jgi:heme/copper-type cytochrome/quinol oxidase subunit 2
MLTQHTLFSNLLHLISKFYFNDKIYNELNNVLDVLIFNQYKASGIIDLKAVLMNVFHQVSNLNNKFLIESNKISNNYKINNDKIFYKKTQYKHMRKSMANMIRIQNDRAVAMPVDTRIQFITVSKDIIHS